MGKNYFHLVPISANKDAASANILKRVKCSCKSSSINHSGANLCSSKKNGLKYISACGEYHEEDCNNTVANKLSILSGKNMNSVLYYLSVYLYIYIN